MQTLRQVLSILLILSTAATAAQTYLSGEISGTYDEPIRWTKEASPYIILDSVIVNKALQIDAGTVVMFRYHPDPDKKSYMVLKSGTIGEEILCNGTPDDPVVFTSERDDAFGDLNGDSSVTIPRPGDWGYIRYQSKTGFSFSSFNHAVFRFGGGRDPGGIASPEFFPMLLIDNTDDFSTTTVNSCTVQYSAGVGIMNGSADITKSTISDCTHGILLNTSEGSVQQSLFTRNAKYPICIKGMWISSWESDHPTESIRLGGNMADNTFTENGQNFFAIEGDVLVPEVINPEGIAIRWERSTIPYLITGPLRIVYPEGRNLGSLSIERGTLIKFKHYREYARKPYIEIHPGCKLIAGMTGDPGDVVFTSEYDHRYDYELYTGSDRDPMPGDWGYIEGSSFELSNCVLKYGGVYYNPQTGRIPADSSAVLRIRVGDSGSTQITSCLFNSLYRDGITFLCEDVVDYGAHVDTSSFLMEKEAYAIRILKEDDVNRLDVFADLNFWNGKFGPYNPVSNPSGNGCRVDNNVHFDPYLSSSDDELDLESSVVWGWTMNTDLDTVPNVLVKMIGKREQNVHSNAEGKYYMSNVYPGFGYKMKGFAPRHKNGLVEDIVVEKDYSHQMDMVLEPRTIDYLLDTITFKVNPEVSEVQEGGTAYRYYKIIDRKTHDPVYGAEVFVNGLGDTLYSNHKGIVTIPISSNKLNGYPNGRNFYISRVGLETLPYPPEMRMNFRVNPLPRDYTKMWGGKLWLKEGISIIELKQETGASIGLAMEDRGSGEEPVNLILERGFQAGAGINLGASAKLTLGPVEAGAEAEVGVNLNALMKDQFIFDYENSSGKLALAKFIVLAGSAFQYLDSPLHRYLGVALLDKNELVAEASFSNSVGLNLHGYGSAEAGLDINLLDSKRKGGVIGAELKGNAEAEGDLDFLFTSYTHKDQLDFRLSYKAEIGVGASAGVGVDLAELFGGGDDDGNDSGKDKDNDKDDDTEIDIDFLSKDLLSAGVSAGVKYGVSISTTRGIPKPYTSLGFMYGYKYDANAEAIFLGGVEAKADREYEFTFDLHDAYLKGILEEKVQLANEIANTDMSNLSLDISSLSAAKIFESPLATFAAEQTRNAFSFPPVPYTQTVTDLVDEGEFKLEISFGIGPVKAKFGAGIEYAEANDYLWKSGVFYDWRLYPLQSYDYVAENDDLSVGPILQDILTESGKYMWKRIKDALNPLPRIFKKIKIWPFNKIRWKGAGDYYHIPVGPESRNSFLVADSITTSEDSLFVYYWDWYGTGEEDQSKGTMDSEELRILEYVKSKAVELHKLDYGIGGFYQFEPNGMLVADSAVLTINYFQEELDVMLPDSTEYTIDENDLRMYVEDKTNNRWICVGGVVEPDSNFVTARIDSLGTFTLAPFTPYGEIVLTASPDSIFVEESDSSHITSNVIYYNT
ncbi:MAG: hypothetical protein GY790_15510, partial [Bacteroidetes bacterium]|nr:hypothetical protein [Bacteroidota bacterium]